ncbi:MAG: hypothetical protein M1823_003901 [Watsoniomyces obsoletus]|nr:MAG: hypothetical protein M1823_003901 [Watsoniomyces obsoletus]
MGYSVNGLHIWAASLVLLVILVRPSHAFGAGNIASVSKSEGVNWRHGDIEDTLLTLLIARAAGGNKFSKLDVKRTYFGNWLRDYSQAVDVGTVKSVSAEAIRILLWILGFLSFGYGTKEFEVTTDRLGCYRPEEHIDNPKNYADNVDARRYDPRLRGPVDERRELSVDPATGMKSYIASENLGITTSAGLIRDVFGRCIALGRQFARSSNKDELYEALRLLGTGMHCLEDFLAHSNYTELALIELGEQNIFPHVGRRTMINLRGARQPVWPVVTGTFGGVDFLHSVVGELSDKATQSEIQELEGTMQQSQGKQGNSSALRDLLSKLPAGLIGGGDQSAKMDELQHNSQAAQMQNMHISPRQPEEWTKQLNEATKQIYPALLWHDDLMRSLTESIEKIPVLPDLIETFQEQINVFVFSLIAPYVVPIVSQIKVELTTGSSEVIQSSRAQQLIVFHDDYSTDPTHSMLSKDHFSNVLNEAAGKSACAMLKWVVPQIVQCWDDERVDPDRTINRIIRGVLHHPALRHEGEDGSEDGRLQMFAVVEEWWGSKSERERQALRDQLSREGVQNGRNHKEGVHDSGHGCGKPLGMPTYQTAASSGAVGGSMYGGRSGGSRPPAATQQVAANVGKVAEQAAGGGVMGSIVGGLVGGVGASLLGGVLDKDDDKKKYSKQSYDQSGGYRQTEVEAGYHPKKRDDDREYYAQAERTQTSYPSGERRDEYRRYEQPVSGSGQAHGYQQVETSRPSYGGGGGYERTTEKQHLQAGGQWETTERYQQRESSRSKYDEESRHGKSPGRKYGKDDDSEDDDDDDDDYKKKLKKEKKKEKKYKKKYGGEDDDDSDDDDDDDDDDDEYKKKKKKDKKDKKDKKKDKDRDDSPARYGQSTRGYDRDDRPQVSSHGYDESRGGGGYGQERSGYDRPNYESGGGHHGRETYSQPHQQQQGYEQRSHEYGSREGEYQREGDYSQQHRQRGEGYGEREREIPARGVYGGDGDDRGEYSSSRQEYGSRGGGGYGNEEEEGSGGYGSRHQFQQQGGYGEESEDRSYGGIGGGGNEGYDESGDYPREYGREY